MSGKNPFLGLGLGSPFLSFARPVVSGGGGIDCSTLPAGQYLDLTAKKSFDVGGQENTPRGVFVGSSGTKMYVTGEAGDGVDQYTLSTAWDPSSASHDGFKSIPEVLLAKDLFFSSDGTRFYVLDDFYDRVTEYGMSTPWDITSGATHTHNETFGFGNQDDNPTGLTFSSDGVYMYVMSSYLRYVNRFTLSTPWDTSTAGSRVQNNFPASQITNTGQETGIAINNDGTRFVIVHVQGDEIEEYTFSTPYDITTSTHVGSLSIASDSTFPTGCCWGNDGQYFYVSSSTPTDTVFRYETCSDGAYKILGRP